MRVVSAYPYCGATEAPILAAWSWRLLRPGTPNPYNTAGDCVRRLSSCPCLVANQDWQSPCVLPLLPRACRLRSHPATDYLQGDGPLSLPIALPDRLTQITYAIRVRALLVSHRTCRVRTHSGFFRALFVAAAVFRGSPSLFGVVAGACIAISLLKIFAAGVLLRWSER